MAKKSAQARLTIPKDIWDTSKFDDYDKNSFGFFISNDSRAVIANILVGKNLNYEFLGSCSFDAKHRCFVPKNVLKKFYNLFLQNQQCFFVKTSKLSFKSFN